MGDRARMNQRQDSQVCSTCHSEGRQNRPSVRQPSFAECREDPPPRTQPESKPPPLRHAHRVGHSGPGQRPEDKKRKGNLYSKIMEMNMKPDVCDTELQARPYVRRT